MSAISTCNIHTALTADTFMGLQNTSKPIEHEEHDSEHQDIIITKIQNVVED